MKKKQQGEVKTEIEKVLVGYSGILNKLTECQKEIRKLRHDIDLIVKKDPILESLGFIIFSLGADPLDRLNNLDLSRDKEYVDLALEKLSKK